MENPAEPREDDATAAETDTLENPEIVSTTTVVSQEDELSKERSIENEDDVTQSPEDESSKERSIENEDDVTQSPEDESSKERSIENEDDVTQSPENEASKEGSIENGDDLTESPEEKPEVHFASAHTSISYVPEEEEDTLSMISILLEQFTGNFFAGLPRILSLETMPPIEYRDTFTQTFFKAMTKLSNRRFVEIINMQVDHEDPTLVFFCPSYELLTSFQDNDESSSDV